MTDRLSRANLGLLPHSIRRPPRAEVAIGIVHFGPGAFHRAHQASYIDHLLDRDPRWAIAAVSMRSRGTVAVLAEQDGLYTVTVRDAAPELRLIDAHRAFLAPEEAAQTHRLLASPAVGLVTTTVTEKGYCLLADGTLDLDHPDICGDLAGGAVPRSVVGWIVRGLAARRAQGIRPYDVMPCDNLAANGRKLHAALIAFARETDAALADWIEAEVRVPSTMVDSITPASDDVLYADVAAALGITDGAAVQREAFVQWVIEDLGQTGPDLASVGATLSADVGAWERAKLRILNGAHSTLAYIGILRGAETVAGAMRDAWLAQFIEEMIATDIVPTLPTVAGLDLRNYADAVITRFANPAIAHRLEQIAQDGTQKLPYRLGDTLAANRTAGRAPRFVLAALGCWVAFVIGRARSGTGIIDPEGETLAALASEGSPAEVTQRLATRGLGLPRGLCTDRGAMAIVTRAAEAALHRDWVQAMSPQ